MPQHRPRWLRYAAAPLTVAVAMLVRLEVWPGLFVETTFLPVFVAVLFCAWLGGLGPGLLATLLGAVAMVPVLFQSLGPQALGDSRHLLQLALYFVLSLAVVVACESLHRERRRARALRVDVGDLEVAQAQLRELAAHLSENDRRKDEFLATLAHELRNPLAPMRNSLELQRIARSPAEIQAARETLERQLAHLVRLVDDLLDVSRITRDELPLYRRTVSLADIVQGVVASVQPLLRAQGLTLEVQLPSEPVHVHADAVRIAQVLGNLLHNAGKFTPSGGHVSLHAAVREGDVRVTVSDDGIGIAPELQERVFEMFRQGDASLGRSHGGLGIGLGLARRLVEMHDGAISLHSDGAGHGTRVCVDLPLATDVPAAVPVADAPAAVAPARRRVVVADDNADAADSMAMMLRLMGHDAFVARDGLAAVELARRERPDLVLLDIGMPVLNGLEACRRLRAMPEGERMRIVAVTGWGQAPDRARSHEAGFDEHLVKPLDPQHLQRLLGD